ncbi:FtsQ-type POTRA domain-containing protein [Waterburya agarophytonicola K14]|uniref:FtsQ-type POTRA domain-containing protein n=1 Tax=Waterburya agarophytonicola KI4 TaxID=2874699 RepID=A0A964FH02_9CYAN|nr:FtsQ-type POTRA domain-containing protein [Waterburya agarophytonicola]MCC0178572.1 FtsQ-type POTRA domain-containing protein [Waterburya agarophytonicola KI4]
MTPFPPPNLQYKLAAIDLQEQRLARIALWRSCLLISLILSLGLLTTLPFWKVKHQSQIIINGKQLVGTKTIHHALEFPYSQFIWAINSTNLTQKLESIPSVRVAHINKQIIPPKVIISVEEREPIAIATFAGQMGFLDRDGAWIAQEFYTNIDGDFTLPKLVVLNYQSNYQKSWKNLYQLISLYPELKINEVQWHHSGNLFLQTKIGRVSLGTNSSRLSEQFKIMLKLQNLNDRIDKNKIAYIDLSNPNANLIQRY